MNLNSKYRQDTFIFDLSVVEAIDFEYEPVLLLEKDIIGNLYLSYLTSSDNEKEQRAYIQVSKDRLNEVLANEMTLYQAYKKPENNFIFFTEYSHETGKVLDTHLIPANESAELDIIPENYVINYRKQVSEITIDQTDLLDCSIRKQKLLFDFYLSGGSLDNSIKHFAFYKVFTPVVEMIKAVLEIDGRNADKYMSFSNFRAASLGITIEINYSNELFEVPENNAIENLIRLFNAQSADEIKEALGDSFNRKYMQRYKTIIRAIIDNDAVLHTAYANPVTRNVRLSEINKKKALAVKELVDTSFDTVEDEEKITGIFLEISTDKETFKIYSPDDDDTIKGKFDSSILDRIKDDFLNIGSHTYTFTIKSIYEPATTLKPEDIKRFLVDYKK